MIKEKHTEQLSWWDKYVLGKQTFTYQSPLSVAECKANIARIRDNDDPKHEIQVKINSTQTYVSFAIDSRIHTTHDTALGSVLNIRKSARLKGRITTVDNATIIQGVSVIDDGGLGSSQTYLQILKLLVLAFFTYQGIHSLIITQLYPSTTNSWAAPVGLMIAIIIHSVYRIRPKNIENRDMLRARLEQAIGVQRKSNPYG